MINQIILISLFLLQITSRSFELGIPPFSHNDSTQIDTPQTCLNVMQMKQTYLGIQNTIKARENIWIKCLHICKLAAMQGFWTMFRQTYLHNHSQCKVQITILHLPSLIEALQDVAKRYIFKSIKCYLKSITNEDSVDSWIVYSI